MILRDHHDPAARANAPRIGGAVISRDQAREIAEREIIARGLSTGVKAVYRPDELDGRALRNI